MRDSGSNNVGFSGRIQKPSGKFMNPISWFILILLVIIFVGCTKNVYVEEVDKQVNKLFVSNINCKEYKPSNGLPGMMGGATIMECEMEHAICYTFTHDNLSCIKK